MSDRSLRAYLALAAALAVAGCESDGTPAPTPNEDAGAPDAGGEDAGPASSCTPLRLGPPAVYLNIFGQVNGVKYPVLDALGDPALPEYLLVELLDSTTEVEGGGFLPPLTPGEFDLTEAPDDTITTCQHCVSLVTDVTEGPGDFLPVFQPAGWYFQRTGTLSLSEAHDPVAERPVFAGSLTRVELAEIDLDDPAQPFVDGGACYYVDQAAFDKRPTPGKACEGVDECGNELLELCDPVTLRCVDESQCNIDAPCANPTDFCIQQSDVSPLGACYPRCDPFATGGCPDGRTCVQYGISEHDGYCLTAGAGEVGDACEVKSATTSCAGDAVCWEGTCLAQCGYFSSAPACDGAGVCDVLGHCTPSASGSPVELGETCANGAVLAQGCAQNGERFDGICFGYRESDPLLCQKSCYADENDYDDDADDGDDDPDCAADQFCAIRFSSRLGVCQPDPVCGDGALGEVGELCDDDNTMGGDGCSADCKVVEYDVLCARAAELAFDAPVESSTAGGVDGFKASCQLGLARGRVYTLVPPGPGQVALTLTSSTQQVVSVRTSCDNAAAEVACEPMEAGEGTKTLTYQVTAAAPTALTVLVNAYTGLEEAPFTLTAAFTPQVCGDGVTVGAELCDDGNDDGGDGCSADCLHIEYDYFCAQAPALTSGQAVRGDIADAPHLFTPTCGYGQGADRLYRFTAQRAGTLALSLNQLVEGVETDLALSVLGTCSPAPETELACSSVYSPAEELSVEVESGQVLYVSVDGLFAKTGAYELTATLR